MAYHRGRLPTVNGVSGGLMAATGLSAMEAEERLRHYGNGDCVLACDNSPVSTTLSGAGYFC